MKEHVQQPGVRKYAGDDLIELQSEPLKAIQTLFKEYPPCVVQGCEVEALNAGTYAVTPGLLSLQGLDAAGVPCHKLVPFEGATGVVLPAYFTLTYETQTRVYGDGKAKPIAYKYKAALSAIAPATGVEYLQIPIGGALRWVDVLGITKKLDREGGQAKEVLVNYAAATTRNLPTSGTKLGVLFGLVTKWFMDLKALAFKDKVSKMDLDVDLGAELDGKVVAKDIDNKIDALQIGGENLLDDSKDNSIARSKAFKINHKAIKPNDVVTLRLDVVEKTGDFTTAYVVFNAVDLQGVASQGVFVVNQDPTLTALAKGFSSPIDWILNGGKEVYFLDSMLLFSGAYENSNTMRVQFTKLEQGNKATDWLPSLADNANVLSTKVDKIDNKGLSTNDYTSAEKTKLSQIDVTDLRKEISDYNGDGNWIDPNIVDVGFTMCYGPNCPEDGMSYYINTFFYGQKNWSRAQIATTYFGANEMYIRNKYTTENWVPWERLAKASELYKGGMLDGLDSKQNAGELKNFVSSGFDEYGPCSILNFSRNRLAYFTKRGGTVELSKPATSGNVNVLFMDNVDPLFFGNPSGDISITLNLPGAWDYMRNFAIQFSNSLYPTKFSIWQFKDNVWSQTMLIENNTSNVFSSKTANIDYGVTKIRITAHEYANVDSYALVQLFWYYGGSPLASYALPLIGGEMYGDANWKEGSPKVLGNTVWHAGNDGHSSGLDADTVDGKHASDFELAFAKNNAFNKNFGSSANTVCQGNDERLSDARIASDVYRWAKTREKPSYSASEVGAATVGHSHNLADFYNDGMISSHDYRLQARVISTGVINANGIVEKWTGVTPNVYSSGTQVFIDVNCTGYYYMQGMVTVHPTVTPPMLANVKLSPYGDSVMSVMLCRINTDGTLTPMKEKFTYTIIGVATS